MAFCFPNNFVGQNICMCYNLLRKRVYRNLHYGVSVDNLFTFGE